jgi:hypothetical protein
MQGHAEASCFASRSWLVTRACCIVGVGEAPPQLVSNEIAAAAATVPLILMEHTVMVLLTVSYTIAQLDYSSVEAVRLKKFEVTS